MAKRKGARALWRTGDQLTFLCVQNLVSPHPPLLCGRAPCPRATAELTQNNVSWVKKSTEESVQPAFYLYLDVWNLLHAPSHW